MTCFSQSWLYGRIIGFFDPAAVELNTSRGIETQSSKLLMRWSVILTDLLGAASLPVCRSPTLPFAYNTLVWSTDSTCCILCAVFFPAVWLCASVFTKAKSPSAQLPVLAVALFQPAAILIDHGHFQYNNIGLGLSVSPCMPFVMCAVYMLQGTSLQRGDVAKQRSLMLCQAAAAALVAMEHDVLGSVLYTLAVNHKLMCVYYAPAFFGHLLGRCLQRPTVLRKVWAASLCSLPCGHLS